MSNYTDIFGMSARLFRNNIRLFVSFLLLHYVLYLPHGLRSHLPHNFGLDVIFMLVSIPLIGLSVWSQMAFIFAASERLAENPVTMRQSFERIQGKFWRFVHVGAAYWLITLIGFSFFLLPGIYWGTLLSFSMIAAVLEDRDHDPFMTSRSLVAGNFFLVLVFTFLPSLWALPFIFMKLIPKPFFLLNYILYDLITLCMVVL